MLPDGEDVLRLITLRSNDQLNTSVYGYTDRVRGIHGTRLVMLMHLTTSIGSGSKKVTE